MSLPIPMSEAQVETVEDEGSRPRGADGRPFRVVTVIAAVGASLLGGLWLMRALGLLVPVAGPYSGQVIGWGGAAMWVLAVGCFIAAPVAWTPGRRWVARRWWWLPLPALVVATTMAFSIGHHLELTVVSVVAAVVPVVLLGLAAVLSRWTVLGAGPEPGSGRLAGRIVVDLASLLMAAVALFYLAFPVFGHWMVVPTGATLESGHDGVPAVIVENLENFGVGETRTWVQRGLVFLERDAR